MHLTGLKSILLGTTLIGRGNFCVSDMRTYVERLQTKGHFTSWSKKSVKIGLCNVPPTEHNAAMLTLFNTTAMSTLFSHIYELFEKLYSKKVNGFEFKNNLLINYNILGSCSSLYSSA